MKFVIASTPVPKGEIRVPGDKSITHRALMLSSIAEGTSRIHSYSRGADCMSTLQALKTLGVKINHESDSVLSAQGCGLKNLVEPVDIINCGNSGTTMRLLTGLLSGQGFYSVLTGDVSLRSRPMDRVVKPLSEMGAKIKGRAAGKYAPLSITGNSLHAVCYVMTVASAQVKSAILLAGLYAGGVTEIKEPVPTRDHTERMLELYGCLISKKDAVITISGSQNLHALELHIPGDISSAAFFIVWATITHESDVCIRNVGVNPCRIGILEVLNRMGANIAVSNQHVVSNEPVADLIIKPTTLSSTEVAGYLIPKIIDEIPILAVAATQAHGITVVKDAQELRIKETDRIDSIVNELKKMGAKIEARNDGFIVEGPTKLHGAECDSYDDHRIAMALTIAGFVAEGTTTINDTQCIAISFPEFVTKIHELTKTRSIKIED